MNKKPSTMTDAVMAVAVAQENYRVARVNADPNSNDPRVQEALRVLTEARNSRNDLINAGIRNWKKK